MEAILTAFVLFIFLILCGISFAGGYYLGLKKRPADHKRELTAEELTQTRKIKKEYENFMSYSGDKQEDIND